MRRVVSALLFVTALGFGAATAQPKARTVKVTMDDRKPDGRKWDGFGAGGPDPYIKVDGHSYRGSRCENSFTCTFRIKETGPVTIEVWDADGASDDPAGATPCDSGMVCSTSGATVFITD